MENFTNQESIEKLDTELIPISLYQQVINRNDNGVLKVLSNNPVLCNKLMVFYQQLKLSYSLFSNNKCNCVVKVDWKKQYDKKYISFMQSVMLQRYIIQYQKVSNLFYLSIQLGSFLQSLKLFKSYLQNNRYYCNYDWMKYINYKKFSYLVDEPITFNLYKIMACNQGINNLLGKKFLFYYIHLFKI